MLRTLASTESSKQGPKLTVRDSWMPPPDPVPTLENGISGGRDWISRPAVPHRAKCPNLR